MDARESEILTIKKAYQDTIEQKDIQLSIIDSKLDSFDIAITLKDIQLKDIHNEVQKLSGDSVSIAYTLNRILSR